MLEYNKFKIYYNTIPIDLSKQQVLDADLNAMEQINFTGNLEQTSTMFSLLKKQIKTILDFSQGTVKVFKFYFLF